MGFFSETIAAKKAGRAIGLDLLAFFDFVGSPMRVWAGFHTLSFGGYDWLGMGALGSVSGLGRASSGISKEVTFTLSGVPADLWPLAPEASVATGRSVIVYGACHAVDEGYGFVQLDAPFALFAGTMDPPKWSIDWRTGSRSIEIVATDEFVDRKRPRFGLMTNADQQGRFPGDTGLRYRAALPFKTNETPW